MEPFLNRIVAARRREVEGLLARGDEIASAVSAAPAPRPFADALRAPGMSVIAEIKRRSPSKGDLRADLDPAELACSYERGGARALSILTEPEFFGGSSRDLVAAREATALPVLWKDFVLDAVQISHARASGADAVLLIVRILGEELVRLIHEARSLGMCPLVEVFDEGDLVRALEAGADVVGINHRDLETFEEDPRATGRLRPLVPDGVTVVAESAIGTRADIEALIEIDVHAALVGEAVVTAADPAAKLGELLGAATR